MLKSKILAKLQKKFSGVPKSLLGLVADNIDSKVTEESEIDDAIKALDDLPIPITTFANHLQKEGDRHYADGRKANKSKEEEETEEDDSEDEGKESGSKKTPKDKENRKGGNQDTEFAKLTKMVTDLTNVVTTMQQNGTRKTIAEQIAAKAKEKGIPSIYVKGRMVDKEEDIDALIEEIAVDYEGYQQELADQGWSQTTPPAGGANTQQKKGDQKVDNDLVNFAKAKAEQAKNSQT